MAMKKRRPGGDRSKPFPENSRPGRARNKSTPSLRTDAKHPRVQGEALARVQGEALARLQKVMAEAGICSRRGAERLIEEGRVTVNGRRVEEQGLKVDPAADKIRVDGRLIGPPQRLAYYMFNKPAGYLTTASDPRGRPTIDLFLQELPLRVFPVGRLDMDVEGLLILTNDGPLAKRLMHPSSQVPKTYRVKVSGRPSEEALSRLRDGSLPLGDRPAAPAEAELLKTADDRAWILLTITEGRHHQVKRMCSAVGHPVLKLKRVAYGGLTLGTLRREEIRPLTFEEVRALKEAAGL